MPWLNVRIRRRLSIWKRGFYYFPNDTAKQKWRGGRRWWSNTTPLSAADQKKYQTHFLPIKQGHCILFFFIHRFIFYFPDFKQPTKCTVMKKKLACLDLLNDNGGLCMFCWCWNLFAFRRNCNLQAVVASKMNKI